MKYLFEFVCVQHVLPTRKPACFINPRTFILCYFKFYAFKLVIRNLFLCRHLEFFYFFLVRNHF